LKGEHVSLSLALYLKASLAKTFDRSELERIVAALAEHHLVPAELKGSVRKGGKFKTGSPADLGSHLAKLEDGKALEISTANEDFKGTVDVYEDRCAIDLYLLDDFVRRRQDALLADAGAALQSVAGEGERHWQAKGSSGLSIRNFSYPRPRPPLTPRVVDRGMLIDLVDERGAASDEEKKAHRALREAALPRGAKRTVSGPLTVIEWAPGVSLADEEAMRTRLAEREAWLAEHVGGARDPNWNEAGDVRSGFIGGTPHPALTLYSAPLGVGYKAIHGAAPAAEIESTLKEVAGWIAVGRVDDKTEVSDVVIIADSRESAVALHPRMVKAGVRHVVYPGDDDTMWDPFPDGEWIEKR
jgi:hypothetical protein